MADQLLSALASRIDFQRFGFSGNVCIFSMLRNGYMLFPRDAANAIGLIDWAACDWRIAVVGCPDPRLLGRNLCDAFDLDKRVERETADLDG
ncbi:MAG: hypothetical protein R2832_16515, partial [Rhodothermales bacterium]